MALSETQAGTQRRPAETPGRRVAFVIEDDTNVAPLIEDMLRAIGYAEVWHAETVAGALLILGYHRPDIAVLDTNLLGVPAYRVAERLNEIDVPFVVATGYDPARLPDLLRSTVILRKPFATADLAAALDSVTPRSSL
jgi:DNA-binding response OmpR family regulator